MKRLICLVAANAVLAASAWASTPAQVQQEPMFAAYPQSAFTNREEGRVGVELAVNEAGGVEACTVTKPVSAALDEASCAFWKRTRFRAAFNDRGQPVASVVQKFSDWRLPPL